jgi:murein DD-endopeptidase MepM/ murein hydrolase activator NlpD
MRALALLILCAVCASVHASWLASHSAAAQDRRVAMSFVEDLARNEAGSVEIWAENMLAGPTEIMVSPENGAAIPGDPPLPARTVLQAYERRLVARLPAQPDRRLRLQVVPGTPNANPRDVEYLYPLQTTQLQIEQGYGGTYSHRDDQNRHAVDFAADIGTTVIAARAGTVMDIEASFDRAGRNAENDLGRANFVRILHDDGTMALYSHLKHEGILVRVGQRVRKGEPIALSGNTGYSTGPHLHFAVQANRGMKLESIAFRMFGPQGILQFTDPK